MATRINPETKYTALCAALREQLGGAVVSPGTALGLAPGGAPANPENAAAQRIHHGRYPFPVIHIGRYPAVLVTDIAATLLGITDTPAPEPGPAKRRPGRPRKSAAGGAA